ncbi:MAG: hypothetical protein AAF215_26715 [Cyanobacteria bacterium P01_A01_bin.123]
MLLCRVGIDGYRGKFIADTGRSWLSGEVFGDAVAELFGLWIQT